MVAWVWGCGVEPLAVGVTSCFCRSVPAGRLQVSWAKGSKKVTVSEEGARLDLPPLAAKEQVGCRMGSGVAELGHAVCRVVR